MGLKAPATARATARSSAYGAYYGARYNGRPLGSVQSRAAFVRSDAEICERRRNGSGLLIDPRISEPPPARDETLAVAVLVNLLLEEFRQVERRQIPSPANPGNL